MPPTLNDLIADQGGPDKVHFLVPRQPERGYLFVRYSFATDPFVPVIMRISEEHHTLADHDKITLVADDPTYGEGDFCQAIFASMLSDARVKMIANTQPVALSP